MKQPIDGWDKIKHIKSKQIYPTKISDTLYARIEIPSSAISRRGRIIMCHPPYSRALAYRLSSHLLAENETRASRSANNSSVICNVAIKLRRSASIAISQIQRVKRLRRFVSFVKCSHSKDARHQRIHFICFIQFDLLAELCVVVKYVMKEPPWLYTSVYIISTG